MPRARPPSARYVALLIFATGLFIGSVRLSRDAGDNAFAELAVFTARLFAVAGAIATWAFAVRMASVYKVVWPLATAVVAVIVVIAAIGPW